MFDIPEHTTSYGQTRPTFGLLTRGAIVSCRFPLVDAPDKPGPVARPALVVHVFRDRTTGRWMVLVAYGTKQRTAANRGYEVRVSQAESLLVAGLHQPTRFILSRMRILPIGPEFFACKQDCGPVLGYLDEALQAHLTLTCERIVGIAEELRPFLVPADHAGLAPTAHRPVGGKVTGPTGNVPCAVSCDALLREHFIGRSDLVRRLSRRSDRASVC